MSHVEGVPNQDESCDIMRQHIEDRIPFIFDKVGDGQIESMYGQWAIGRRSCDGEVYQPGMFTALWRSWFALYFAAQRRPVFLGHWHTAGSFGRNNEQFHAEEYGEMLAGAQFRYLHYEALLIHRSSPALLNLYMAMKLDPRRKAFVTGNLAKAADALRADLVEAPKPEDSADYQPARDALSERLMDYDFVILACGGLAKLILGRMLERGWTGTAINIGSGLDPLYRGKTRSEQIGAGQARADFREFLK